MERSSLIPFRVGDRVRHIYTDLRGEVEHVHAGRRIVVKWDDAALAHAQLGTVADWIRPDFLEKADG